MGPIGCTETSARNYHYLLHTNPENAVHNPPYINRAEFIV